MGLYSLFYKICFHFLGAIQIHMFPHTLAEKIKKVLIKLRSATPDVEGLVLVDMNGLPMLSILSGAKDDSPISAMAVTILSTAQRTVEELKLGKLNKVVVQGENGYVIFIEAGEEAVLTILATKMAKLDTIFADAELAAQNIAKILAERV